MGSADSVAGTIRHLETSMTEVATTMAASTVESVAQVSSPPPMGDA